MRCPICRREVAPEAREFRPFCSERCKLIDLDNWLSGRYRVSTPVGSRERSEETEGAAGSEPDEHDLAPGE
jgi:endogenous inhibitor of DNA gyrase (YacG/DUF329 family)